MSYKTEVTYQTFRGHGYQILSNPIKQVFLLQVYFVSWRSGRSLAASMRGSEPRLLGNCPPAFRMAACKAESYTLF